MCAPLDHFLWYDQVVMNPIFLSAGPENVHNGQWNPESYLSEVGGWKLYSMVQAENAQKSQKLL